MAVSDQLERYLKAALTSEVASDELKTMLDGFISDVVDDTSPQLGGNLDCNSKALLAAGTIVVGGSSQAAGSDLTCATGVVAIKETTEPTATTDYGKLYTKTDNKLYFQDGGGTEHEVAFA